MMNYVAFSIEQCHYRVLTNRFRDIITTTEGKTLFFGLLALNIGAISQHYTDIGAAIEVGDYMLAGYYLGIIIKTTFDYSF